MFHVGITNTIQARIIRFSQLDRHLCRGENDMTKTMMLLAAATLAVSATAARADGCSGHDHAGGTILGAIAGGVIGGAVSHGNGGAVVGGAILGGLAGNAISRDIDCEDRDYAEHSYYDSFHGDVGRRYEWHHDGR